MIHVSKRAELSRGNALLIRIAAILLAVLVSTLLTFAVTGVQPSSMFSAVVNGSFGSARKSWIFLQNTAILLCISLAVTPAFKMRCWNLGAEGQVLAGAMASAACMILLEGKLSNSFVILFMVVSSVFAGAVWSLIPALFKAKWNTNETLFTLMMNYVATQIVAFFCVKWENPAGSCKIGVINQKSRIGWLPELGNKYILILSVVFILAVFMYFYLYYSKHGYEIAVVGESERTARYIGIKVEKVIIRTMLLSGAICGIAGLLLVGGINHTVSTTIAGGQGFTAVMVSWLAKFNPVYMVLASGFIIFMDTGANELATSCGLNSSWGSVLTGILIFFIIGSEFFINYRISIRKSEKEVSDNV